MNRRDRLTGVPWVELKTGLTIFLIHGLDFLVASLVSPEQTSEERTCMGDLGVINKLVADFAS
ncbi:hypothetical protein WG66_011878 [Moniliophthora roreri]|nr:hypothetical protein WG66_011878 [Moniliophthora roreri]